MWVKQIMNKFKVGDEVKIIYRPIQDKYKGVYKIKKVIETSDNDRNKQYLYKVGNISSWATEKDIEFSKNNFKEESDEYIRKSIK